MKTKLAAVLSAAALCLSSLPVTAIAADEEAASLEILNGLPSWIPTSYHDVLAFYNQHGQTYIQDGYIFCLRMANMNHGQLVTENSSPLADPIAAWTPQAPTFELHDEVSVNDFDILEPLEQLYDFRASVYHPDAAGELSFEWVEYSTNTDEKKELNRTRFSFDVDESGTITETDLFGWLPDCEAETAPFQNEHGIISAVNDYIVYCGEGGYGSGMYSTYVNLIGNGAAEEVPIRGSLEPLYTSSMMMPCGNTHTDLLVYRPVKAGNLELTVSQYCEFQPEHPLLYSDSGCFVIDKDLHVAALTERTEETVLAGDCSGDGVRDTVDLVALQKYLTEGEALSAAGQADLNGDGSVDVFDLALLQRLLLLQSPEPDGNIEFTHISTEMSFRSDIAKEYHTSWSYPEDDQTELVITTPSSSSTDSYEVTSLKRKGSELTVHIRRTVSWLSTADMVSQVITLSVDSGLPDGIRSVRVDETKEKLTFDPIIDDPIKPDPIIIDDPTEPVEKI